VQRAEQLQVFASTELQIMVRKFERDTDVFVIIGAPLAEIATENGDATLVGSLEGDQDFLCRTLASTAGTEEPEDFPFSTRKSRPRMAGSGAPG
jgi:hypothetical protein